MSSEPPAPRPSPAAAAGAAGAAAAPDRNPGRRSRRRCLPARVRNQVRPSRRHHRSPARAQSRHHPSHCRAPDRNPPHLSPHAAAPGPGPAPTPPLPPPGPPGPGPRPTPPIPPPRPDPRLLRRRGPGQARGAARSTAATSRTRECARARPGRIGPEACRPGRPRIAPHHGGYAVAIPARSARTGGAVTAERDRALMVERLRAGGIDGSPGALRDARAPARNFSCRPVSRTRSTRTNHSTSGSARRSRPR